MKCRECGNRCGSTCYCGKRSYCSKCEFCSNQDCDETFDDEANDDQPVIRPIRTLKHLRLYKGGRNVG